MPADLATAGAASAASSTATFYVNYPAAVGSKDLMFMHVASRGGAVTPTVSASWVALTNVGEASVTSWLYYRWGTTTLGGSSTTVIVGALTAKLARIYTFSGIATASTFYEGGTVASANSATILAPAATSTSNNCLAICFQAVSDNNACGSYTGETGADWTMAYESTTSLGSDVEICLQIATLTNPATATNGTYAMVAADPWVVRSYVLVSSNTTLTGIPIFIHDYFRLWAG